MSVEDGGLGDNDALTRWDALGERGRKLAQGITRRVQTGRVTDRDADLVGALIADLEAIELPPALEEQRAAVVEAQYGQDIGYPRPVGLVATLPEGPAHCQTQA